MHNPSPAKTGFSTAAGATLGVFAAITLIAVALLLASHYLGSSPAQQYHACVTQAVQQGLSPLLACTPP